jgi:outer membrane protein OmpA-like peptidoglycan-associated protein
MNTKLMTGMALALGLSACATVPLTDPALETARSAVRSAELDPNVEKYAALDLHTAREDLAQAEAAAVRRDAQAIDQPAYMAAQNAHLAQLRASAKADDARVAAGQADRDQIQLRARTREIDRADMARDDANQRAQLASAAADQANAAADQATLQAAALQAEVDALKAKPTDRGLVLTLGDVLFESGRAELNPGASLNLDRLVQFLSAHPERRVEIDGYTDSVGTDSFNLDLSQRRADTVKFVLVNGGIAPSRITTRGYGKEFNVASNADSGGRQLNRRIEVVIGGDDGAPVAARSPI